MTPKTISFLVAAASVAAISLYPGYRAAASGHAAASAPSSSRQIVYYACPMHPQTRSAKPGKAVDCGMDLEPVYAEAQPPGQSPTHIIHLSDSVTRMIGLRTESVRRASLSQGLRLSGRIAADDARQYRIIAGSDGWVRHLGQNSAGTMVQKNEMLASYYTSNLLGASQSFLYAVSANEQSPTLGGYGGLQKGSGSLSLQVATDSLRVLGMSEHQIETLKTSREATPEIQVYSPANGFVVSRTVSPEQRLDRGVELYRVADLSHVWVLAQVFEKDYAIVKPGIMAGFHYAGREFHARMSNALPQFDAQSRTFRARFEVDNPGIVLRPDMFVDLEVGSDAGDSDVLAVAADAVLNSGRTSVVYVDLGEGRYEPRLIQTGRHMGQMVEVASGLKEGDRVVVGGNFMLDSESRLRNVPPSQETATMASPKQQPKPQAMAVSAASMDAMPMEPGSMGRSK